MKPKTSSSKDPSSQDDPRTSGGAPGSPAAPDPKGQATDAVRPAASYDPASAKKRPPARKPCDCPPAAAPQASTSSGCGFTFNISACGDVHIHNYCGPAPTPAQQPDDGDDCGHSSGGTCLPAVAGAKHKLSREQKMASRAGRAKVSSVLAASVIAATRRYLSGAAPANAMEQSSFSILAKMPESFLRCTVDGYDTLPPAQRDKLFAPGIADGTSPLDPTQLGAALLDELKARTALELYGELVPLEERPGIARLYVPVGEDFFAQVRICRVNQLRTAYFIPQPSDAEWTPAEIQQDCGPVIVNGEPQVQCQVRTSDCPGNPLAGACGRVVDVAPGSSVELEGVNYFDVGAKVRLIDKDTQTITREVDGFVYGDLDTPREETVDGQTRLINDCRVHDKLTFTVPDVPPGIYTMQVMIPNSSGIPELGTEIGSNTEFINILPPPDARYQIMIERVIAREETSPASWGSDEVGLRAIAAAIDLEHNKVDFTVTQLKDLDGVEFDSGTARVTNAVIFANSGPMLALVIGVLGHEIDSDRAYNEQINDWTDYFTDLVKDQWQWVLGALAQVGGISALKGLGWEGAAIAAIGAAVLAGIDLVISLWAPADLIIEDTIPLSIVDLDRLISPATPIPDPPDRTSPSGIKILTNKTIPGEKVPFQYRETREYISDDQDSRYELIYRYNRLQ